MGMDNPNKKSLPAWKRFLCIVHWGTGLEIAHLGTGTKCAVIHAKLPQTSDPNGS